MGEQRGTTRGGWRQWKPKQAERALAKWQASGLPLEAYARQRGVTAQRLRWWRERLGEWGGDGGVGGGTEARLVPAVVTAS